MFGAALATSISYFMCFLCSVVFVYKSELRLKDILYYTYHIKEITALSFVTFSRQGSEYFSNPQSYLYSYGENIPSPYG
jgi:Na+-driven multidrug efflux pump